MAVMDIHAKFMIDSGFNGVYISDEDFDIHYSESVAAYIARS